MSERKPAGRRTWFRRRRLEWTFIGCFAAANLVVPLTIGELYPFTNSPMFRDSPQLYCHYRVIAPDGTDLTLEDFQLQRVYDGNPVGLGAGVKPAFTLDEFGREPTEQALARHVEARLAVLRAGGFPWPYVVVHQTTVGSRGSGVGIIRERKLTIGLHDETQ